MSAPLSTTAIAAALNHVLGQNAWARSALLGHAGRSVTFVADPLEIRLAITPEGLVGAAPGGDARQNSSHQGFPERVDGDVRLSMPVWALPGFVFDPVSALRQVQIEGDAELVQLLGRLLREVRWDAEDDLARVVGDVAAHRIVRDAQSLHAYALDASQRLGATLAAYLIEEEPTLVRRDQLEALAASISTLRDDVARMDKRLELLQGRKSSR